MSEPSAPRPVSPGAPPESPPRVVALVLAAGRARRFGRDKRQARLPDGRSLLQAVLQTQLTAGAGVLALLRNDDDWGQALCREMGVEWLGVPDADQGMGRTLAAGLRSLLSRGGAAPDAALVVLADMPEVQGQTVQALIESFARDGRPAWPWHAGRAGHPRLLPREVWPVLLDLSGDEGARHRMDWSRATRVEVPDRGVLVDIDTPGDLGG